MEYNWINANTDEGLERLLEMLDSGMKVIVRRRKSRVSSWEKVGNDTFEETGGATYSIFHQAPTVEFLEP